MRVALVGNPNSGKTTLFNVLTGAVQYVGNWPGVTVERKSGYVKSDKSIEVIDLPGIYSLSPYTNEEIVSRNYLLNESPDVIINIVDATNIERNLYLTTQILEIGIPVVIVLNMCDVVEKRGIKIDDKLLSQKIGCPVVRISALKKNGIEEMLDVVRRKINVKPMIYSKNIEEILTLIPTKSRFYKVKALEGDSLVLKDKNLSLEPFRDKIKEIEEEYDDDILAVIINQRYDYISKTFSDCYKISELTDGNISDKIDKIATHRILGLPVFFIIIFGIYFLAITFPGGYFADLINDVVFGSGGIPDIVRSGLESIKCAGWLISLICDGIIAGVGAILGFLPQMIILFLCLALLEDCGYMSRIAFVLDKIFHKFGLSGKSFIPMLVATGCGVPGIQASRTIESESDRKITIMTSTFMPCGAKLPIIALISGAFFPTNIAWLVSASAYIIGIAAVIISGIILKKFKALKAKVSPFVMELPRYHFPKASSIFLHVWDRTKSFIKKAGTIILMASVIIWVLMSFSFKLEYIGSGEEYSYSTLEELGFKDATYAVIKDGNVYLGDSKEEIKTDITKEELIDFAVDKGSKQDSRYMVRLFIVDDSLCFRYDLEIDHSILATIGKGLSYVFKPLGFGYWQTSVATITGLAAKENIVSTLGEVYGFSDVSEDGIEFQSIMAANMSSLAAFSFLLFNLLCAPCFAACATIKREMNSGKWTSIAIGYQCALAYFVSLMVYQIGSLFTGNFNIFGVICGFVVLATLLYLLFRPSAKTVEE